MGAIIAVALIGLGGGIMMGSGRFGRFDSFWVIGTSCSAAAVQVCYLLGIPNGAALAFLGSIAFMAVGRFFTLRYLTNVRIASMCRVGALRGSAKAADLS